MSYFSFYTEGNNVVLHFGLTYSGFKTYLTLRSCKRPVTAARFTIWMQDFGKLEFKGVQVLLGSDGATHHTKL